VRGPRRRCDLRRYRVPSHDDPNPGWLSAHGFRAEALFRDAALYPCGIGGASRDLRDFVWDIPQTFFLTITNPGAVLGLFAIFGGISTFVEVTSYIDALTIVAAVMGGSLAWWVGLSHLIGHFRHLVTEDRLRLINQFAGLMLLGFGVVLIGELALKYAGLI
jgi:hypothetical protein